MSRGMTEEDARALIVGGFAEPIAKELPLEYAVEMNQPDSILEMKGSIGLIVSLPPDGGRWPRPRPRPDEGRVCHDGPLMGRCRKLCPHQSASRTASPEGEALALSLR